MCIAGIHSPCWQCYNVSMLHGRRSFTAQFCLLTLPRFMHVLRFHFVWLTQFCFCRFTVSCEIYSSLTYQVVAELVAHLIRCSSPVSTESRQLNLSRRSPHRLHRRISLTQKICPGKCQLQAIDSASVARGQQGPRGD